MHKIKLQKVWFGSQSIVWAARIQEDGSTDWKKGFFEASCRRKNYGISLHTKKPNLNYAQGSLFSILRKNAASGYIKDVRKKQNEWIVSLVLQRKDALITISLDEAGAPTLDCIIEAQSFFRLKPDKIYTKKKTTETSPDQLSENSVLDRLCQSSGVFSAAEPTPKDSARQGGADSSQEVETGLEKQSELQKFRRKQMQRKRKTVSGSIKKNALNPAEVELLELLESELQNIEFPIENIKIEKLLVKKGIEESPQGKQLTFLHETRKKLVSKEKKAQAYLQKSQKELKKVEDTIESLATEYWDDHALEDLGRRFRLKAFTQSDLESAKPKKKDYAEYTLDEGVKVRMGRGAKENDLLTKSLSAATLWLHAAGGQGSHVAIVKTKKNVIVTDEHIRTAAILALNFSSFKKDLAGEVHKTQKRNLKKTKDLAPGKWIIQKAETLFFRYSKEELETVLGMRS